MSLEHQELELETIQFIDGLLVGITKRDDLISWDQNLKVINSCNVYELIEGEPELMDSVDGMLLVYTSTNALFFINPISMIATSKIQLSHRVDQMMVWDLSLIMTFDKAFSILLNKEYQYWINMPIYTIVAGEWLVINTVYDDYLVYDISFESYRKMEIKWDAMGTRYPTSYRMKSLLIDPTWQKSIVTKNSTLITPPYRINLIYYYLAINLNTGELIYTIPYRLDGYQINQLIELDGERIVGIAERIGQPSRLVLFDRGVAKNYQIQPDLTTLMIGSLNIKYAGKTKYIRTSKYTVMAINSTGSQTYRFE